MEEENSRGNSKNKIKDARYPISIVQVEELVESINNLSKTLSRIFYYELLYRAQEKRDAHGTMESMNYEYLARDFKEEQCL